jgi:hypothetical protein
MKLLWRCERWKASGGKVLEAMAVGMKLASMKLRPSICPLSSMCR